MRIRKHQIKLDEFEVDSNISPNDKIIGQDSQFQRQTKNYRAKDLAVYVRGGVGNPGDILHNDGGDTWSWREGSVSGVTTTTTIFVPTTTTTTTIIPTP